MGAVTYIDENKDIRTHSLELIEKHGCSPELGSRLRYATTMVERLINQRTGSSRGGSANSRGTAVAAH